MHREPGTYGERQGSVDTRNDRRRRQTELISRRTPTYRLAGSCRELTHLPQSYHKHEVEGETGVLLVLVDLSWACHCGPLDGQTIWVSEGFFIFCHRREETLRHYAAWSPGHLTLCPQSGLWTSPFSFSPCFPVWCLGERNLRDS